jgi:hypothetical protein
MVLVLQLLPLLLSKAHGDPGGKRSQTKFLMGEERLRQDRGSWRVGYVEEGPEWQEGRVKK